MRKILKIIITILILIPVFLLSILLFTDGSIKYAETIEIEKPIELVDQLFGDIYIIVIYQI